MLLLQANRVVSADRLADGLWGEQGRAADMNTLQSHVSHLRKALGRDLVQTRPPGYVLAVEPNVVDAFAFERLLDRGRRARRDDDPKSSVDLIARALTLWRGDALSDFTYAEWARPEISRLQELRLAAVEEWVDARLELGDHGPLVGELDRLLKDHPLRERLWRARILALYRGGRQADALRAYRDLRELLSEELGIDPSPALAALELSILRQDSSLEWLPRQVVVPQFPVPRSSFVGRQDELAELESLLASAPAVTLVGAGGVGKTRLALELASRIAPNFDAVRLVDLSALADPALVLQHVASACGVREEHGCRVLDDLVAAIGARRFLLVLDNCEHLVEAVAALADGLLRWAPRLSIIGTSREPLRIDGEQVWRTPSLPAPTLDSLPADDVLAYDAVRLFVARAKDASAGFALTAENASAVSQICRRLDGIPLALELAAARLVALTPSQIATRLDYRFELLRRGARTAPTRHQTLLAAVEWSYDLCSPAEQELLACLSVFSGSFSSSAAAAVCSNDVVREGDVVDLLSALVDRSLVVAERAGEQVRFHLLETLRHFGRRHLTPESRVERLARNHAGWMLRYLDDLPDALGRRQHEFLAGVERELENLRQALQWSVESGDGDLATRLAVLAAPFWDASTLFDEGHDWLVQALDKATAIPDDLHARGLLALGTMSYHLGDFAGIRALMGEADPHVDLIEDDALRAEALTGLGATAVLRGDDAEAEGQLLRAMVAWERSGRHHGGMLSKHLTISHLSILAARNGDHQRAHALLEEALVSARHVGNDVAIGNVLEWLAHVRPRQATTTWRPSIWPRASPPTSAGAAYWAIFDPRCSSLGLASQGETSPTRQRSITRL